MKRILLWALFALFILLPARANINFSDSVRISLLTCSPGPDAYERFGHAAIRVQDLRHSELDLTFHYGVFSFNAPNFIYRFVKGETDYQLGALYTSDFVEGYRRRGLGMEEQQLHLDSAQCQDLINRLWINYRPENRTYRYSFFFDNCSTRPYRLINTVTSSSIQYDSAWTKPITLRQMVQEKSGVNNWLDFGIALAVAGRSDQTATYQEQMFLPEYLMHAYTHAQIPAQIGSSSWFVPLVDSKETLLEMRSDVQSAIAASDPVSPASLFGVILLIALVVSAAEYRQKRKAAHVAGRPQSRRSATRTIADTFDCLFFLSIGLTGCIVWFLNFFSEHPAVDHNLNCLWLLPTHVIVAVLIWFRKLDKMCIFYFGITFAAIILYVILDWMQGQYCPAVFLLILATLLLRSFMRFSINYGTNGSKF